VSFSVLTFLTFSMRVGGWIRVLCPETVVSLLHPASSAAGMACARTPARVREGLSYAGNHGLANLSFSQRRWRKLQIILFLSPLGLLGRAPSLAAQAASSPAIALPTKLDTQPADHAPSTTSRAWPQKPCAPRPWANALRKVARHTSHNSRET
jgi:hypothetical protein